MIRKDREPAELKHLSRRRKRNRRDAVSKGDRKRHRANRIPYRRGRGNVVLWAPLLPTLLNPKFLEWNAGEGDSPVGAGRGEIEGIPE